MDLTIQFQFHLFLLIIGLIFANGLKEDDAVHLNNASPESRVFEPRIVNGVKAAAGQFPFTVSFRRRISMQHFCGGSVIGKKWILTAGHCMFNQYAQVIHEKSMIIVGGDVLLTSKSLLRQENEVQQIIINPRYDHDGLIHDIAILQLINEFKYSISLMPVALPQAEPKPGAICKAAGWGYPSETNRTVSVDLMYVDLPLLQRDHCKTLLKRVVKFGPSMLCAGYDQGGKDACQGDSGGPLICGSSLSGIVSGGDGCAKPKLPGFYTNTLFYRPWIEQVLISDGNQTEFQGIKKYLGYGVKLPEPNAANLAQFNAIVCWTNVK